MPPCGHVCTRAATSDFGCMSRGTNVAIAKQNLDIHKIADQGLPCFSMRLQNNKKSKPQLGEFRSGPERRTVLSEREERFRCTGERPTGGSVSAAEEHGHGATAELLGGDDCGGGPAVGAPECVRDADGREGVHEQLEAEILRVCEVDAAVAPGARAVMEPQPHQRPQTGYSCKRAAC